MGVAEVQKPEGYEKKCESCGSVIQRRYESEMYAGSFILHGQRVEVCKRPNKGYEDPIKLDSKNQFFEGYFYKVWAKDNYFSRNDGKNRSKDRLHRAVWSSAFGNIPENCHIHHKNGNKHDNRLCNLELMDAKEHLSLETKKRIAKGDLNPPGDKALRKASEWHKSEEGKKWHKEHDKKRKGKPQNHIRVWKKCLWCNKKMHALVRKKNEQRFCHVNCQANHYRQRKRNEPS